jgi:hypothetical protein
VVLEPIQLTIQAISLDQAQVQSFLALLVIAVPQVLELDQCNALQEHSLRLVSLTAHLAQPALTLLQPALQVVQAVQLASILWPVHQAV